MPAARLARRRTRLASAVRRITPRRDQQRHMIVLFGSRHAEAQDHLAEKWRFGKRISGTSVVLADRERNLINAGREFFTVEQRVVATAVGVGDGCGDPLPPTVDPIKRYGNAGTGLTLRGVQHVCRQPPHGFSLERGAILPSGNYLVNSCFSFC